MERANLQCGGAKEVGEDFQVFCKRFMATLMFQYLKSISKKSEGDFTHLKKICRETIPETVQCIDKVGRFLKSKKEDAIYSSPFPLPRIWEGDFTYDLA